jgi:phage gp45-like
VSLLKHILFAVGLPRSMMNSNEAGPVAKVQVINQASGQVQEIPSAGVCGLTCATLAGCDHVTVNAEGDPTKGVAIASNDQRFRPKGIAGGETMLWDCFTPQQSVYLKQGSHIIVDAAQEIDLKIGGTIAVTITSTEISLMVGGFGILITSSGTTIDGKPFLPHEHINGGGTGNSGIVA